MKRIRKRSCDGVTLKDLGLSFTMPVAIEGEGQSWNLNEIR